MDIRARGPRVRRRGRAPKQPTKNKANKTTHGTKPDRDIRSIDERPSAPQPESLTVGNPHGDVDADGSEVWELPPLDFEFSSDGLNFQSPTQPVTGENIFVPPVSLDFVADMPQFPAAGATDKWPFSEFLDDSMALPIGAWMPQVSLPEQAPVPECDGMVDSMMAPEQTCQDQSLLQKVQPGCIETVKATPRQLQKSHATAPLARELDSQIVTDLWTVLSAMKVKIEEDEKFWRESIPAEALYSARS